MTKSILIIDDDEDMGDALFSFLKEENYSVRLASSGKQGLAVATGDVPQLILLDWQMPQMGGQQVLVEIAASDILKNVPVILMSANVGNIPAECLKSRRHLCKPFDVEALVGLVAEVLAHSE